MSQYQTRELDECLRLDHELTVIGSNKTPMRKSLVCVTCSGNGKTVMLAHGVEANSFGTWRRPMRHAEEVEEIGE